MSFVCAQLELRNCTSTFGRRIRFTASIISQAKKITSSRGLAGLNVVPIASNRADALGLGDADLPCLQIGVPRGGNNETGD
jgi:hypothetical protein